ncbi:MAG: hypothetical protein MHPSP_000162, partial [Paramarteilia canceri]
SNTIIDKKDSDIPLDLIFEKDQIFDEEFVDENKFDIDSDDFKENLAKIISESDDGRLSDISENCKETNLELEKDIDNISALNKKEMDFEDYLRKNNDSHFETELSLSNLKDTLNESDFVKIQDGNVSADTDDENDALDVEIAGDLKFNEICCFGLSLIKDINLINKSSNWALCKVSHQNAFSSSDINKNSPFPFLYKQKVILEPESNQNFRIIFTPQISGEFTSTLKFNFYNLCQNLGDNQPEENPEISKELEIYAKSEVPEIIVEGANTSCLDFGPVTFNTLYEKQVKVYNNSDCTVPLTIDVTQSHKNGEFSFSKNTKVIQKHLIFNPRSHEIIDLYLKIPNFSDNPSSKEITPDFPLIHIASAFQILLNHPASVSVHLLYLPIVATLGHIKLHIIKMNCFKKLKSLSNSSTCQALPIKNAGNIPFTVETNIECKNKELLKCINVDVDSLTLQPGCQDIVSIYFKPSENLAKIEYDRNFNLILTTLPKTSIYKINIEAEIVKSSKELVNNSLLLSSHKSVYFGLCKLNSNNEKIITLKNNSQVDELYIELFLKENGHSFFLREIGDSSQAETCLVRKTEASFSPNQPKNVALNFMPEHDGLIYAKLVIRNLATKTLQAIHLYGYGGSFDLEFKNISIDNSMINIEFDESNELASQKSKLEIVNNGSVTGFFIANSGLSSEKIILEPEEKAFITVHPDSNLVYGPLCMRNLFLKDFLTLKRPSSNIKVRALNELNEMVKFTEHGEEKDLEIICTNDTSNFRRQLDDHLIAYSFIHKIKIENASKVEYSDRTSQKYKLKVSPKFLYFDANSNSSQNLEIVNESNEILETKIKNDNDYLLFNKKSFYLLPMASLTVKIDINNSDSIKTIIRSKFEIISDDCKIPVNFEIEPKSDGKLISFIETVLLSKETQFKVIEWEIINDSNSYIKITPNFGTMQPYENIDLNMENIEPSENSEVKIKIDVNCTESNQKIEYFLTVVTIIPDEIEIGELENDPNQSKEPLFIDSGKCIHSDCCIEFGDENVLIDNGKILQTVKKKVKIINRCPRNSHKIVIKEMQPPFSTACTEFIIKRLHFIKMPVFFSPTDSAISWKTKMNIYSDTGHSISLPIKALVKL